MNKRRNWVLILFGVLVVLAFVGIGAIVATTAWVRENLTIEATSEGAAEDEFEQVRARFPSRPPLIEMRDDRPGYTGGKLPDPPASPAPVDRLHVLVWDPDEQQLASFSIPFWFLRLKSGPIEFSSYAIGFDDNRVNLRPEDLEKYGPGLVLDVTTRTAARVLVWTE